MAVGLTLGQLVLGTATTTVPLLLRALFAGAARSFSWLPGSLCQRHGLCTSPYLVVRTVSAASAGCAALTYS
jgi:hypothetical protein